MNDTQWQLFKQEILNGLNLSGYKNSKEFSRIQIEQYLEKCVYEISRLRKENHSLTLNSNLYIAQLRELRHDRDNRTT